MPQVLFVKSYFNFLNLGLKGMPELALVVSLVGLIIKESYRSKNVYHPLTFLTPLSLQDYIFNLLIV